MEGRKKWKPTSKPPSCPAVWLKVNIPFLPLFMWFQEWFQQTLLMLSITLLVASPSSLPLAFSGALRLTFFSTGLCRFIVSNYGSKRKWYRILFYTDRILQYITTLLTLRSSIALKSNFFFSSEERKFKTVFGRRQCGGLFWWGWKTPRQRGSDCRGGLPRSLS